MHRLPALFAVLVLSCGGGERAADPLPEPTEPVPEPPEPGAPPEPEGEPVPDRTEMLAIGGAHGCHLTAEGVVRCWGGNQFAQLGDPDAPRAWAAFRPRPAPVAGLEDTVRIDAGTFHTCALSSDGAVRCWGHGGWGQLGDGAAEDRASPVPVRGIGRAIAITAGERHGCARLSTGGIVCWGDNGYGQLGDGTRERRAEPVRVGLESAVEVCAGRHHTCARHADATVSCWGAAFEGQLGDGESHQPEGSRPTPAPVPGLAGVSDIACGAAFACALLADGGLRCWGANDARQLGVETRRDVVREPAEVVGVSDVSEIHPGSSHACVRTRDRRVTCWGANAFGQLGDGTRDPRREPWVLADLGPVDALGVGIRHSCVLAGGTLRCWGSNARGQLGDGTRLHRPAPVEVGVVVQAETPAE